MPPSEMPEPADATRHRRRIAPEVQSGERREQVHEQDVTGHAGAQWADVGENCLRMLAHRDLAFHAGASPHNVDERQEAASGSQSVEK